VNTPIYTVSYAATRAEVWRGYWREWARTTGLWRLHVLIGLAVGFAVTDRGNLSDFSPERFTAVSLGATAASVVLSSLWPQIRFKPQTRALTLDVEGFKTTIGSRTGERSWRDVRRVEDRDGNILIVGVNGNAMIIPMRAFATEADRQHCLESVKAWHAAATANSA
jgi:hypothetical protein